jgi:uncharacterized membrane protein
MAPTAIPAPARRGGAELLALVLRKLATREARRLRTAAADTLAKAGGQRVGLVERGLSSLASRLPIQCSIDVAVPVEFAWRAWSELHFLPEGVDRVIDIERDGDQLSGRLAGITGREWRAEITDEREAESFAWRSTEGSDCAGLVTFHRLSDRLTRIELDLDVVPVTAVASLALLAHLAHWRTVAELRRLKAGLEFVSPDAYADDLKHTTG